MRVYERNHGPHPAWPRSAAHQSHAAPTQVSDGRADIRHLEGDVMQRRPALADELVDNSRPSRLQQLHRSSASIQHALGKPVSCFFVPALQAQQVAEQRWHLRIAVGKGNVMQSRQPPGRACLRQAGAGRHPRPPDGSP
jgi:hypothetical protein